MDYTSDTELERVANVLKGLSHETRVALLLGLYHGKTKDEITEALGMTRGGIHKSLERMREAELVYRPEESEYTLTPLGSYWARLLDEEADDILAVLEALDAEEEPVREDVEETKRSIDEKEDQGMSFQIDDATWERTIHTEKWKRAYNKVCTMLDLPADESDESA